jgi:transcriptional regulator
MTAPKQKDEAAIDEKAVLKMVASGASQQAVADAFKTTTYRVYHIRKAAGLIKHRDAEKAEPTLKKAVAAARKKAGSDTPATKKSSTTRKRKTAAA